jgi:uncharacterized membrane protein (UPF0136 family)
MTPLKWLMVAYGLMNIGLGLEAFIAKGSIISLAAGGGAGVLMLVCVYLTKDRPRIGYIGAAVICLALIGNFLPKFLKDTTKIYPALVVTIASVIVFVALAASHMMATRKRS